MVAQLQPVAQSGILIQTQPKLDDEKGRKSMNRRKGQNGVVIQSGWYRVRWRVGIEGQEERIHMSEKVAPVVIDKDGNPKPASQAVQRLAREIVERSGANSVQHFNQVVFGEVSFRDQTKEYLRWAGSRDRKRIKDLVSVEGALNQWILPIIGDLPLTKVNNITVKPPVDKMKKANLAAATVNKYVNYLKQVVASLRDGATGAAIRHRKWDSVVLDLPIVNQKNSAVRRSRRKPSTNLFKKARAMNRHDIFCLLHPECEFWRRLRSKRRNFTKDGCTIQVWQQVHREKPPRHRFAPGSCRVPESVHMLQGWLAVQDPERHAAPAQQH